MIADVETVPSISGQLEHPRSPPVARALESVEAICLERPNFGDAAKGVRSPFVLALSGLFLRQAIKLGAREATGAIDATIEIQRHLLSTKHRAGRYNFYDAEDYWCDTDTTSVVNLFLHERRALSDEQRSLAVAAVSGNRTASCGAVHSWFGRPRDYLDWGVTMSAFAFLCSCGYVDRRMGEYLINGAERFLDVGSHYYNDPGLPLLLLRACSAEIEAATPDFLGEIKNALSQVRPRGVLASAAASALELDQSSELSVSEVRDYAQTSPTLFRSTSAKYSSVLLGETLYIYLGQLREDATCRMRASGSSQGRSGVYSSRST